VTTWTLNSETSLQSTLGEIRELWKANKWLKVTAKTGKPRSSDQNSISHAWYEQLARELPEDDTSGWKSYCKLHIGVPLLRAEDGQFREFYDAAVKGLKYEQKLAAMKFVPVTSLMTKGQLSKYLEAMQMEFVGRGVQLEFPQEGE
jgi:hypothetical protein